MSDCIFCKIINKEIPSKIVFENEDVIAFEDLNKVAPVHVLVVPKKHIKNVMELNEEDNEILVKIFDAIKAISKETGIARDGFRVINNCGDNAGQTVHHIHFHLIGGKNLGELVSDQEN